MSIKLSADDSQAITDLIAHLRTGWNQGDGEQFAAPFSDDAGFTVWNGRFQEGKQAIATSHQHIFDTFYKGTQNHMEVVSIRPLRPDVVLVYGRSHLTTAEGNVRLNNPELSHVAPLFVVCKNDGRWQIEAFQNTPVFREQLAHEQAN